MGFDGGNCAIQTDFYHWNRIYNITFFERSVLSLLDGYLLWMFVSALVMLVVAASGSLSLSVSVPSLLMLGVNFLDRGGYVEGALKFIILFPHKMTTAYGNEPIVLYFLYGQSIIATETMQIMCLHPHIEQEE